MPKQRIKLGMVGGGQGAFIGGVHRIAARLDDRYELVAGALSSDAGRAAASAQELGIEADRSYSDFKEMAKAEAARPDGIDVVSVVTPNHLHAEPVIAFAQAGINVICDKPLADTWDNACKVRDALQKNDVCFLLTHNYTGHPLIRQAREMIQGNELGQIRAVRAAYIQDWLSQDLENQGFKQAEWRTDPARSGPAGCVGDIGTHAFQLLRYVTGLELDSLAADLTTFVEDRALDDHADILLRYGDDVRGSLTCSQVCVGNENNLSIEVYGSKGSIRWAQENPNEMTVVTKHGTPPQRYTRGSPILGKWAQDATRTPPGHPEGYLEAFAQLYSDMADHIQARKEGGKAPQDAAPVPDIYDGLAGMAFIDAAVRSSKAGGEWTKLNSLKQ